MYALAFSHACSPCIDLVPWAWPLLYEIDKERDHYQLSTNMIGSKASLRAAFGAVLTLALVCSSGIQAKNCTTSHSPARGQVGAYILGCYLNHLDEQCVCVLRDIILSLSPPSNSSSSLTLTVPLLPPPPDFLVKTQVPESLFLEPTSSARTAVLKSQRLPLRTLRLKLFDPTIPKWLSLLTMAPAKVTLS